MSEIQDKDYDATTKYPDVNHYILGLIRHNKFLLNEIDNYSEALITKSEKLDNMNVEWSIQYNKIEAILEWFVDHVEFERDWHDEYMTADPEELRILGNILGVLNGQ